MTVELIFRKYILKITITFFTQKKPALIQSTMTQVLTVSR